MVSLNTPGADFSYMPDYYCQVAVSKIQDKSPFKTMENSMSTLYSLPLSELLQISQPLESSIAPYSTGSSLATYTAGALVAGMVGWIVYKGVVTKATSDQPAGPVTGQVQREPWDLDPVSRHSPMEGVLSGQKDLKKDMTDYANFQQEKYSIISTKLENIFTAISAGQENKLLVISNKLHKISTGLEQNGKDTLKITETLVPAIKHVAGRLKSIEKTLGDRLNALENSLGKNFHENHTTLQNSVTHIDEKCQTIEKTINSLAGETGTGDQNQWPAFLEFNRNLAQKSKEADFDVKQFLESQLPNVQESPDLLQTITDLLDHV